MYVTFAAINNQNGAITIGKEVSLSGEASVCEDNQSHESEFLTFDSLCDGSQPDAGTVVIFDTDMGPDIDDALALAMLHAYQSQGKIELGAVTVSRNNDYGARYSDIINTFYGRPNIPIGVYRGRTGQDGGNHYTKPLSDSGKYPHDIHSNGTIPEGYKVIRRVLEDAADDSVIIIQVGFSGNLSKLMDSQADAISSQSGLDLVKNKVKVLSLMAGNNSSSKPEFNVEHDLSSAKNLLAKWPVKIIQTDWFTGSYVYYPASSVKNDMNYVANHPIKEAYLNEDLSWHEDAGNSYNMRSWDLMSVISAVEEPSDYYMVSKPGKLKYKSNGASYFTIGGGEDIYLGDSRKMSSVQKRKIVDRMIELVTARP